MSAKPRVLGALFTKGLQPDSPPHHARMTPEMGRAWAESVNDHGYEAVLFTDVDCSFLPVTEVRMPCRGFPHMYRFIAIADYVKTQNLRGEIWCTDVRDVVMTNRPQPQPGFLYVGSEPDRPYSWRWLAEMQAGCPFWTYTKYPGVNYNCGIMGGIDIGDFLQTLSKLNKMCRGLHDMHSFIYALQSQKNIVTGHPVHSVFTDNTPTDAWFAHK